VADRLNAFVDRTVIEPSGRGLLDGLTLAVKANIPTGALPASAGTPGLAGHTPPISPAVDAVLAAGARIVGTTNMHELACGVTSNNGWRGAVRNPFDPERVAGGSSGGSAAAVAAGLADVALGTDTGGSCRIPAAWCGVVGWRPTTGRYALDGVVPLSWTRDTIGCFARNVDGVARLDAVLSGTGAIGLSGTAEVSPAATGTVRIGVPRALFWEHLDADVRRVCAAALDRLATAGIELVGLDIDGAGPLDAEAGFPIALYELGRSLPPFLAAAGVDPGQAVAAIASPDVARIVGDALAAPVPEASYRRAVEVLRPRLQAAYSAAFAGSGVDVVAFPTVPVSAPRIGQDEVVTCDGVEVPLFPTVARNTSPGSVAGVPGLSLPCGFDDAGVAVGLELDGPAGCDAQLLAVAAAIESLVATP
jgi:mandelamide amidase